MPAPLRCDRVDALADPEFLGSIFGPVRHVERAPMGTPGFSGSTHIRLDVSLEDGERTSAVLKRTRLDADWTAYRTEDRLGREAMLLSTLELAGVWDVFASPYLAYAMAPGQVGLLMQDLAPCLLPDVREPVTTQIEDALLSCLARMHARYWGAIMPAPSWLARPENHFSMIGPVVMGDDPIQPPPSPMLERVAEGWEEAFRRLPAGAARLLRLPAEEHERRYSSLPRTLVHGDVKVANFAFLPDGRIAAFDWALVGHAPASQDLGWYVAVNASRLARTKEAVTARYRELLETHLGRTLDEPTWSRHAEVAVVSGALMLLWSKALAVRDERPGAQAEWDWWVERLPR